MLIFLFIQAQALGQYFCPSKPRHSDNIFLSAVTKLFSKFLSLDGQNSPSIHPQCLDLLLHISASAWRNYCVGRHVAISLISFTCSMTLRVPLDVCRLPYTLQGPNVPSLRHVMEHCAPVLKHCVRVTQICVFNTVKLGTSASSP